MNVRGPPLLELLLVGAEADSRHVVDQRVEPHVDGVVRTAGPRYAPLEASPAGDAHIAETALKPGDDFVAPVLRHGEAGVALVELAQSLLVLAQTEEEVLLLDPLYGVGIIGMELAAAVDQLVLFVERFAARAVEPLIRRQVHIVVGDPAADEFLDAGDVIGVDRPDEPVVADVPCVAEPFECGRVAVDEGPCIDTRRLRRLLVLRGVVVGAGQEEHVIAALTVETGKRVRAGLLVRVMKPRCRVDVVDSGRQIELHGLQVTMVGVVRAPRPLFFIAAILFACTTHTVETPAAQSPTPSPSVNPAVSTSTFDGARAKAHVDYLADPARAGRYSGSAGYLDAATYVAERFREIGLEPAGDSGTFFQHFTMPIVDLTAMSVLATGEKAYRPRVDFTESVGGRSGSGSVDAEISVVGGAARSGGQNDFAGANVRGKIALITGPGAPGGASVVESAYQEGAAAVLVIGGATLRYSYAPRFQTTTIPTLVITEGVANELIAARGKKVSDVQAAVRGRRSRPSAAAPRFGVPAHARIGGSLTPVDGVDAVIVSNEAPDLQQKVRETATSLGIASQAIGGGGSDQTSFARRRVPAVFIGMSDYILHVYADKPIVVEAGRLKKAGDVVTTVAHQLATGG